MPEGYICFAKGSQMAPLQAEARPRANASRNQAPAPALVATNDLFLWVMTQRMPIHKMNVSGRSHTYHKCVAFGGGGRDARAPYATECGIGCVNSL